MWWGIERDVDLSLPGRIWQKRRRIWRCGREPGRFRLEPFHLRDETVASPRERFDVTRTLRRVAESFTQFVHGGIKAVIEIHERICWPEPSAQFLSRDKFAWPAEQASQNLKRLAHQPHPGSKFPKFVGVQVNLKGTKARPI
jgi:hypothetical protein